METASTMKSTSAVEGIPMESAATMKRTMHGGRRTEAMSNISVSSIAMPSIAMCDIAVADIAAAFISVHPTAAISPVRMTVPRTAAPSIGPAPLSEPPRPVEPGAGSNEEPSGEPIRTVITVRRAGVWIVAVVAIRANRRWSHRNADWPDADADAHLRL